MKLRLSIELVDEVIWVAQDLFIIDAFSVDLFIALIFLAYLKLPKYIFIVFLLIPEQHLQIVFGSIIDYWKK